MKKEVTLLVAALAFTIRDVRAFAVRSDWSSSRPHPTRNRSCNHLAIQNHQCRMTPYHCQSSTSNTRLAVFETFHGILPTLSAFDLNPSSTSSTTTTTGLLVTLPAVAILLAVTQPPPRLASPATLESIVEGTFLARATNLKCVYKASRNGWSALDFHTAVDGKGSGVVVARSLTGKVFGGYNPSGWRSTDDYYTSTAAFLWCLRGNRVVKLPILTGGNAAVYDYATGGPCFGPDLQIGPPQAAVLGGFAGPDMEDMSLNAGNLRQGKSSVGITYNWDDAWPARGSFQLSDLEVYCND